VLHVVEVALSATVRLTVELTGIGDAAVGPGNCTDGVFPVALPPVKAPLQLKETVLPSGSDPSPLRLTVVVGPVHSAT
jgi:hypothetical protein